MEEDGINSGQVINADSSLATTLSRLENVRAQVELIQKDTNNLKQDFNEMANRINALAATCHHERDNILKRRAKA